MFLYEFEYIPLLSLRSTASLLALSLPGRYNETSRESAEKPVVGFFGEVNDLHSPYLSPEKHFVGMKSVLKLSRTSARDGPGEL